MKKTILIFAALLAVCGCRKGLREPPDWNPEKSLGQRNRAAPKFAWEVKTNTIEEVAVATTNEVEISTEKISDEVVAGAPASASTGKADSSMPFRRHEGIQTRRAQELPTVGNSSSAQTTAPRTTARPKLIRLTKPMFLTDEGGAPEKK